MYKLNIQKNHKYNNVIQNDLELQLYSDSEINKINELVSVGELRNDISYIFEITGIPNAHVIKEVYCFANDEDEPIKSFNTRISIGSINFDIDNNAFSECYGFLQLTFVLYFQDDSQLELKTGNISVLIRNETLTKQVRNMVNYIFENCEPLIYESHSYSKVATNLKQDKKVGLESTVQILADIAKTYKTSYISLINNAKYRTIPHNTVGPFEKVHKINHSTINYIVSHPEQLHRTAQRTAIKHNGYYYQPKQTLITSSKKDYSVYENIVIVSFIEFIKKTINSTLLPGVEKLLESFPHSSSTEDQEYINSAYVIFQQSRRKFEELNNKLKVLSNEFANISKQYVELFKIKFNMESVLKTPDFTQTFRQNPIYRRIYMSIKNWYDNGNYELQKENLIVLSFLKSSRIYEFYILLKIIESIRLTVEDVVDEKFDNSVFLCSEFNYNNVFKFILSDNKKVELYYQPIIYAPEGDNNIGLIRNYRYNFNGKNSGYNEDRYIIPYYNPDYLIKIKTSEKEKYIILDAKFSQAEDQKRKKIQELSFKYIFSLSPKNNEDELLGICIICGKDKNNGDNKNDTGYIDNNDKRLPFADFPTVTGKNTTEIQTLARLIKKYYKT